MSLRHCVFFGQFILPRSIAARRERREKAATGVAMRNASHGSRGAAERPRRGERDGGLCASARAHARWRGSTQHSKQPHKTPGFVAKPRSGKADG